MEYFKNDSVNVVLRSGRKTVEINTIIFSGKCQLPRKLTLALSFGT